MAKLHTIARLQVAGGANIFGINFEDGLLDGVKCMRTFLNMIAMVPDIAALPINHDVAAPPGGCCCGAAQPPTTLMLD